MNKAVKKWIITGIIALAALVLLSNSFYIVREDEVAVLYRLGRVDRVIVNPIDRELVQSGLESKGLSASILTKKGLNFKVPFIETVESYSSKYQTYISESATINTFDSRRIDLSIFAQYRVVNPALFNMTIGLLNYSGSVMDDRVYPAVIQTANTLAFNEFFDKDKVTEALDSKRDELNKDLTSQFGLYIVDIGIFRKNFPQANIASIEEKMTQEIQKESEKLMAEGDSLLVQSKAETDRIKDETVAKALEEAAVIKAEADAEAARINEEALRVDVEFYRFIRRMETYRNMKDTTVFLDQSNDFVNYINNVKE
jgi:membrane protease subunit HflC